jgi:TrmH family RNA methyltransferase
VIYSDEIARKERAAGLIERLRATGAKTVSVSEKLLESVSYTKTPQGLIVLAVRPAIPEHEFKLRQPADPLLVLMHGINNPVNVGAIIRTAEAAGVTGIVATTKTSDPFSAKALRGAMGSAFRLPIWMGASYSEVLGWCVERGIRTISSDASASRDYTLVDWIRACALIVGPESTGLSSDEMEQTDETARIPMKGAVESLNVAVATGILLYEAARQRTQK